MPFIYQGPGYIAFQQPGAAPCLVSIFDERAHGELRRPINHAYTLSALKGYEPYIDDTINKLVAVLDNHSKSGERIDIRAWLHYCKEKPPLTQ
jgi:cytochrome P450